MTMAATCKRVATSERGSVLRWQAAGGRTLSSTLPAFLKAGSNLLTCSFMNGSRKCSNTQAAPCACSTAHQAGAVEVPHASLPA